MPRRRRTCGLPSWENGALCRNLQFPNIALQDEFGRFGPREESEWDEGRPKAGRHVHRLARPLVETGRVARPRMREAVLPFPAEREGDLPVVHVAGEDEVKRSRRQEIEDVREMAEEDPQVR